MFQSLIRKPLIWTFAFLTLALGPEPVHRLDASSKPDTMVPGTQVPFPADMVPMGLSVTSPFWGGIRNTGDGLSWRPTPIAVAMMTALLSTPDKHIQPAVTAWISQIRTGDGVNAHSRLVLQEALAHRGDGLMALVQAELPALVPADVDRASDHFAQPSQLATSKTESLGEIRRFNILENQRVVRQTVTNLERFGDPYSAWRTAFQRLSALIAAYFTPSAVVFKAQGDGVGSASSTAHTIQENSRAEGKQDFETVQALVTFATNLGRDFIRLEDIDTTKSEDELLRLFTPGDLFALIVRVMDELEKELLPGLLRKVRRGSRVGRFTVVGTGERGWWGVKDGNDVLLSPMWMDVVEKKRHRLLAGLLAEERVIEHPEEMLFENYKSNGFVIPSRYMGEVGSTQEVLDKMREITERVADEIDRFVRGEDLRETSIDSSMAPEGLSQTFMRNIEARERAQGIDRIKFGLFFGMSQAVENEGYQGAIDADIQADQAMALVQLDPNIRAGEFSMDVIEGVLHEVTRLFNDPVFRNAHVDYENKGGVKSWMLKRPIRAALRKNDGQAFKAAGGLPRYFEAARKFLRQANMMDYVKQWDLNTNEASERAGVVNRLIANLDGLRTTLAGWRDAEERMPYAELLNEAKKNLDQAYLLLRHNPRHPDVPSKLLFHARAPPQPGPVRYMLVDLIGFDHINGARREAALVRVAFNGKPTQQNVIDAARIALDGPTGEIKVAIHTIGEIFTRKGGTHPIMTVDGDEITLVVPDEVGGWGFFFEVLNTLKNSGSPVRVVASLRSTGTEGREPGEAWRTYPEMMQHARTEARQSDNMRLIKELEKRGIWGSIVSSWGVPQEGQGRKEKTARGVMFENVDGKIHTVSFQELVDHVDAQGGVVEVPDGQNTWDAVISGMGLEEITPPQAVSGDGLQDTTFERHVFSDSEYSNIEDRFHSGDGLLNSTLMARRLSDAHRGVEDRIYEALDKALQEDTLLNIRYELLDPAVGGDVGFDFDKLEKLLQASARGKTAGVQYALQVIARRFIYTGLITKIEPPSHIDSRQVSILFDRDQLNMERPDVQALGDLVTATGMSVEALASVKTPTVVLMFTPGQFGTFEGLGGLADTYGKFAADVLNQQGIKLHDQVQNVVLIPIPAQFSRFGIASPVPWLYAAYRYARLAQDEAIPLDILGSLDFILELLAMSDPIVPAVVQDHDIKEAIKIFRAAA